MRAPTKAKVRESLLEQLRRKGAQIECFEDLIFDYLSLYDAKNELQKDIKKRGVSYEQLSSSGVPVWKQNQSVKDLVMVNKQMLMILEKLKLTTDAADAGDDEQL